SLPTPETKSQPIAETKSQSTPETKSPSTAGTKSPPGVILIPSNVDLTIKADAERISYHDLVLTQFQGGLNIRDGAIELSETGFQLIGCTVSMQGKYAALSPH